jgi:hypothetical protein
MIDIMTDQDANFDIARNRVLVLFDWIKAKMFGRDVSRE